MVPDISHPWYIWLKILQGFRRIFWWTSHQAVGMPSVYRTWRRRGRGCGFRSVFFMWTPHFYYIKSIIYHIHYNPSSSTTLCCYLCRCTWIYTFRWGFPMSDWKRRSSRWVTRAPFGIFSHIFSPLGDSEFTIGEIQPGFMENPPGVSHLETRTFWRIGRCFSSGLMILFFDQQYPLSFVSFINHGMTRYYNIVNIYIYIKYIGPWWWIY